MVPHPVLSPNHSFITSPNSFKSYENDLTIQSNYFNNINQHTNNLFHLSSNINNNNNSDDDHMNHSYHINNHNLNLITDQKDLEQMNTCAASLNNNNNNNNNNILLNLLNQYQKILNSSPNHLLSNSMNILDNKINFFNDLSNDSSVNGNSNTFNYTGQMRSNFSTIAAIIKSLSSNNIQSIGNHLLPICTPLLQIAIRQAINECLPNYYQLNIKGKLELSINNNNNNNNNNENNNSNLLNSQTLIEFNDFDEHYIINDNNINNNDNNPSINNNVKLTELSYLNQCTKSEKSLNVIPSLLTTINHSSSRRKPSHPNKRYSNESATNTNTVMTSVSTTPTITKSPITTVTSPIITSLNENMNNYNKFSNSPINSTSNPTSPSTIDSGVLDLSRAGSLAGSAPITPMKGLSLSSNDLLNYDNTISTNNNNNNIKDQELLENYQKQLIAFSQIQAVWKMALTKSASEQCNYDKNLYSHHDNNIAYHQGQNKHIQYSQNHHHQHQQGNYFMPNLNPIDSITNSVVSPTSIAKFNDEIPVKQSTPPPKIRRVRTIIGPTGRLTTLRRSNSNRRFPCNQCKEEFPSLHTLEQHTLYEHGTYRCHICKAQFTQRSNLQRHALKHVGFKPFECRVCSKAYYRKDHLMRHMEMGHPGYIPRENITVHLTSSESLDFLNNSNGNNSNNNNNLQNEIKAENYFNSSEHESFDTTNSSSIDHTLEQHSKEEELDREEEEEDEERKEIVEEMNYK